MSKIKYQDITDSISQIKAEQLDENVDIGDITRQALMFGAGNPAVEKYGKYLVPAVGGGLALAALNKKPKKRTFGSFLKTAALAGLGATAAELGKRELMLRNPDTLKSPYMRPAVGGREPGLYLEQKNNSSQSKKLNENLLYKVALPAAGAVGVKLAADKLEDDGIVPPGVTRTVALGALGIAGAEALKRTLRRSRLLPNSLSYGGITGKLLSPLMR